MSKETCERVKDDSKYYGNCEGVKKEEKKREKGCECVVCAKE